MKLITCPFFDLQDVNMILQLDKVFSKGSIPTITTSCYFRCIPQLSSGQPMTVGHVLGLDPLSSYPQLLLLRLNGTNGTNGFCQRLSLVTLND